MYLLGSERLPVFVKMIFVFHFMIFCSFQYVSVLLSYAYSEQTYICKPISNSVADTNSCEGKSHNTGYTQEWCGKLIVTPTEHQL